MSEDILGFEECLQDRGTFEKWSRRSSAAVYLGDGIALCRVANRFKMYVPTRDLSLAPHLMMEGYWESWISVAFYRVMKLIQPSVVINVGANLGYYSLFAASVLPESKVVAYEPQPGLARLVDRSRVVNGLSNIEVRQKAVGAKSGTAFLKTFGDLYGSAMIAESMDACEGDIKVEVTALDEESEGPIDCLIIDAEGFEFEIMKGAGKRLEISEKVVALLEFSAPRYADKTGFVHWLNKLGFSFYRILYDSSLQRLDYTDLLNSNEVIDLLIVKGCPEKVF